MGSIDHIASTLNIASELTSLNTPQNETTMFEQLRCWIYCHVLTYPTFRTRIRFFRFGIPLVMKRSFFTKSTESEALRFLHGTGLDLPIPKVFDSFVIADASTLL